MATRRQTFLIPSGMHMVSVRDNVAVLKKKNKKTKQKREALYNPLADPSELFPFPTSASLRFCFH